MGCQPLLGPIPCRRGPCAPLTPSPASGASGGLGMEQQEHRPPPSWPPAVSLHPAPFTAMSLPGAFTLRGKDCVAHSPALTDPGRMLLSK